MSIKTTATPLFFVLLLFSERAGGQQPEEKWGWKLGVQAYTFKLYTFFEVLDKLDSCDVKYVEASPGRDIGGGFEGRMDYHMDAVKRTAIRQQLAKKKAVLNSYGVVVPKTGEDWKLLFEFAREMGIQTIVSEPERKDLPLLSKLADEYGINVAFHNHPAPSLYWHPDSVLSAVQGYSKRLGACADIGHWVRCGLKPVDCLKRLEGRLIELHCKDLNEWGGEAHDVIWGTGVSDIPAVVNELKRQQFSGAIFAEYEYHWEHNTPEVKKSMANLRGIIKQASLTLKKEL